MKQTAALESCNFDAAPRGVRFLAMERHLQLVG